MSKYKNKTKILFIHNVIIWYRTPFFRLLSKEFDIKYVFTKIYSTGKMYGIKGNIKELEGVNYIITKNIFGVSWKLVPILLKEDYDAVIAPTMDSIPEFINSIITFIIAKMRRKPIAYLWGKWELKNLTISLKKKIRRKFWEIVIKPFIRSANVCIAYGTKAAEYFLGLGINKKRIFIAPNASEVNEMGDFIDIRQKYFISNNMKVILYFGRIIKRKGLDYLIRAFAEIEKERTDSFLLICGDGDFKNECEKLSKSLNIKNIKFTGFVLPINRGQYFSQCNIFVLPSFPCKGQIEPWGLSLNEAMQFSKPVIATTAVGAAYDIINNGVNGYTIPFGNINALYTALRKIISDDKLEKNMGLKSKEIIENIFTYEHMVQGYKKALKYILNNK